MHLARMTKSGTTNHVVYPPGTERLLGFSMDELTMGDLALCRLHVRLPATYVPPTYHEHSAC